MDSYADLVFCYYEALPINSISRIPMVLTFNNPSKEALLFRLLTGTIDLSNNHDMKKIKQRVNYSHVGTKLNKRLSAKTILDCPVPISNNNANIDKYFKRNRKNTPIFEKLLFEFSHYFYQKNKGSHIAAFVHLYRCLEYISFSFPMVYASKSNEYKGTYDALKSFFSEQQKSELKFFKTFQQTLIDGSILNLHLDFNITAPDALMRDRFNNMIIDLTQGLSPSISGSVISIKYRDFFDFIINLRNRFFHMLAGDNQHNINSTGVCMDYLFNSINDDIANWIAYIYFEITKYGVESI